MARSRRRMLPRKSPPTANAAPLGALSRSGIQALSTLAGSVTLLGGLLFYFGWAYTSSLYLYFGIHSSVLGFGTSDYLLRSINASFWPLMLILLVSAAQAVVYATVRYSPWSSPLMSRSVVAISIVVTGSLFYLAVSEYGVGPPIQSLGESELYRLSLLVTAAAWMAGFTLLVARASTDSSFLRAVGAPLQFLTSALLVLCVFWAVGVYADYLGRAAAVEITSIEHLDGLPAVTLVSSDSLGISGPGVIGEQRSDEPSYQWRYTGLRLLVRSDHRYILAPCGWARGEPVLVIPETLDVRVEFETARPGLACGPD